MPVPGAVPASAPGPVSQPAYLNGEFLPLEQARVPVLDRGFLFGDGVYEVLPFLHRRPLFLAEHLRRLGCSLAALEIPEPLSAAQWAPILERLVRAAPESEGALYLQVTRGAGERRHLWSSTLRPTVLALCLPKPRRVPQRGLAAVTCEDIRWDWCYIKAITLLPNVLLRRRAERAGADEAILTRAGKVVEGAASNVFVVKAGRICTPPKSSYLLPGITRDLLLEELRAADLPCAEQQLDLEELRAADEIWLTGSTLEVAPVYSLDGRPLATPAAPLWPRALALYRERQQRAAAAEQGGA